MDEVIFRLSERGLSLPEPPKPGGSYESVRVVGATAYVSVQFAYVDGQLAYPGRLGRELSTEQGYKAAELCALNVLAQLHRYVGFERIEALIRVEAYLQTVADWDDFPVVVDGASDLFLAALGERGQHARTLAGVEQLPGNACIALVTSFSLRSGAA